MAYKKNSSRKIAKTIKRVKKGGNKKGSRKARRGGYKKVARRQMRGGSGDIDSTVNTILTDLSSKITDFNTFNNKGYANGLESNAQINILLNKALAKGPTYLNGVEFPTEATAKQLLKYNNIKNQLEILKKVHRQTPDNQMAGKAFDIVQQEKISDIRIILEKINEEEPAELIADLPENLFVFTQTASFSNSPKGSDDIANASSSSSSATSTDVIL